MSATETTLFRKNRKRNLVKISGGKCNLCGYDKTFSALEFHHINPNEKKYGISTSGTCHNIESDLEEIQKCILVCANCHREIHDGLYDSVNLFEYQKYDKILAEKILEETKNKLQRPQQYCKICGAPITRYSKSGKCGVCSRINFDKPDRELLKEMIRTTPFTTIGKKYNVTDNAVRKWCKFYNLPTRKTDINNFSNEEWNLI